jgi:hypothetical protein
MFYSTRLGTQKTGLNCIEQISFYPDNLSGFNLSKNKRAESKRKKNQTGNISSQHSHLLLSGRDWIRLGLFEIEKPECITVIF